MFEFSACIRGKLDSPLNIKACSLEILPGSPLNSDHSCGQDCICPVSVGAPVESLPEERKSGHSALFTLWLDYCNASLPCSPVQKILQEQNLFIYLVGWFYTPPIHVKTNAQELLKSSKVKKIQQVLKHYSGPRVLSGNPLVRKYYVNCQHH